MAHQEIIPIKERPRKHAKVIEVVATDVETLTGGTLPAKMLKVNVGGDRRGVVFVVSQTARAAWNDDKLGQVVRTLGDLVHPHPATLIVLPDGEQLGAYEVVVD